MKRFPGGLRHKHTCFDKPFRNIKEPWNRYPLKRSRGSPWSMNFLRKAVSTVSDPGWSASLRTAVVLFFTPTDGGDLVIPVCGAFSATLARNTDCDKSVTSSRNTVINLCRIHEILWSVYDVFTKYCDQSVTSSRNTDCDVFMKYWLW